MESTVDDNNSCIDEIQNNSENKNENENENSNNIIENNYNIEKDDATLQEEIINNKNKLIDTEIYHLNYYDNMKIPENKFESFESREDINYPFDDDDHDNDSFPSNPWIFSSDEESNLFDEDQYEDARDQINEEEWIELYNNDEIFNFIYNDKNLFPGYFQNSKEDLRVIDENNIDTYNIDDPDDRMYHEFKSKMENNNKLDEILDKYFKTNEKEENFDKDNSNQNQDSNIIKEINDKMDNDNKYEDFKYKYNKLFKNMESIGDLKDITIRSYEISKNKILKKYMDYKKKYYLLSDSSLKKFNSEIAQKDFLNQKREIEDKKNTLKEDERLFSEITNDIHDIQNTSNILLTDYVNNTMKLCEYAKQKYPDIDISDSFTGFDYNINHAYKLRVPMSQGLQEDIKYRNMYIEHKDKYKMLLLSKKLINLLNEKRIQIAFRLGISTLEYEKIKDLDYLTEELEKQRLKEMLLISKKLSKMEHYKCLKLISSEKQKKRDEKEKEYLEHLKNKSLEEKMSKKRKEAYLRVLKVKNQVINK
ncbi:hypothetical protein PIROE2DRAFT_5621 [Piromyces sp. E2]|nr:hypothetical protein PIROE2DRAFT_5621 [Piromyces sp. E2]|eukprot:OUM67015.1 hypothetical protein PIROE2DRAFT_5621 [Piromyces sp. E2]